MLGRISGLYGVKGWLRLYSYTEPREALLAYKSWLLRVDTEWLPMAVEDGRAQGKSVIARLAGINDRDAAARYIGADVAVPRAELPEAEAGRFYWADLVGLEVRHRSGQRLGTVAYMLATGAHDVMVVHMAGEAGDAPAREVLIPFVPDRYVLKVDLAARVIDVDWEWD